MADIADVDPDLVAAPRQLGRFDRVVVVAGVLGIHGEDQPPPEVFPSCEVGGGHRPRRGRRLGERRRRKFLPDSVAGEDRPELRSRLLGRAEDGLHRAEDRPPRRRRADADLDQIPGPGFSLCPGRHDDLPRPAAVPDRDRPFRSELPDHPFGPAGQHPRDGALEAAAPAAEGDLDFHQIPRQGAADAGAGDVDVLGGPWGGRRVFRKDPAVPFGASLEPAPREADPRFPGVPPPVPEPAPPAHGC